jgi:NADPH:quinone reductase-like Zn-dependent oxidoreductase
MAVGSSVLEFQPRDGAVTHLAPKFVEASGDNASASLPDVSTMLGQGTDGTLRSIGVFAENALVHAPMSLGWLPAATLTCTWTIAWNSLFGVEGKKAGPGTWVLVQGTRPGDLESPGSCCELAPMSL